MTTDAASDDHSSPTLDRQVGGAVTVPRITAAFWVTKALTTAFGESASDWLVRFLTPIPAVLLGFVAFCVAMAVQFRSPSYSAWRYWSAVSMVGVFGTMAADVAHVGLGVPYPASTALFVVALAAVFVSWKRTEGTVAMHSIDTPRREVFYWAAVVSTFALGTAAGDLAANVVGLGYLPSALLFTALLVATIVAIRFGALSSVTGFWGAYVLTRPVGASAADWLGKSRHDGGVGIGSGAITAVLAVLIVVAVAAMARRAQVTERTPVSGTALGLPTSN